MKKFEINLSREIEEAHSYFSEQSQFYKHKEILNLDFKDFGVVYALYLKVGESIELKYIGKSKGYLFKRRIINHFIKKHEKTGSKLNLIYNEFNQGNKVLIKLIKTVPESYRNTIEEELINKNRPDWNIQKGRNKAHF
jgi:hypothetical protein